MSAPQLRKIVLNTGNILEMEDLIRKAGQTTNEELRGSIKTTLNSWEGGKVEPQNGGVFTIPRHIKPLPANEEYGTKTTVKLFLSSTDSTQVEDAIKTVSDGLDLPCIDSVIVTPPDVSDDVTLASLEPMWRALEEAVTRGAVTAIGLADMPVRLLTELYEWATVKPTTVQVNLSSCCVVPKELTAFAQQHDIQVLTHNDPAGIDMKHKINSVSDCTNCTCAHPCHAASRPVSEHNGTTSRPLSKRNIATEIVDEEVVSTITSRLGVSGVQCQVEWVARHRTIQQCFGLIQDKGYTVALACHG